MSGKTSRILTTPETTDFYTGSRPMVADMFVALKDAGRGYLQLDFTEPLAAADLAAYPMAVVAGDGVELSGCSMPSACAGGPRPDRPRSVSTSPRCPDRSRRSPCQAADMVLTDDDSIKRWYCAGP